MAKLLFHQWAGPESSPGVIEQPETRVVEGTLQPALTVQQGDLKVNIPAISLMRTNSTYWATIELCSEELCKLIDD